jgi:hypothetical protein
MNKSLAQVLHVPSLFLAALLQLLPLARAALPVTQNAANIIVIIFRWVVGSAAVLGSVQAMSGASTRISSPKSVTATNGEFFTLRLRTSPYQSGYWEASNVPPGLGLVNSPWRIEGVPTTDGIYQVGLVAKESRNSGPSRTVRDTMTITVISLTPSAPNILAQPTNTSVTAGQSASLSVVASGSRPMAFFWRRDGVDVPGATNATLSLTSLTTNDTADFDVILTNRLGSATSAVARLTVLPLPLPLTGAGLYNGLFHDSNNVQQASAGFFTATVRTNGDFTARIQNGKKKFLFKGRFNRDGHATNQVLRVGDTVLTLEMHLDPPGGKSLSGRVTDGVWTSDLLARRTTFNAKTNPATALSGRYTLLIPGATDGAVAPQGDGAAAVTVTTAGLAALTGTLADGSKIVQRVALSADGDWPFYVPLYAGRGAVFGWMQLQPTNEIDLAGALQWIRPAGPLPKLYTNGFVLASMAAGAVYTPPIGTVFDTNFAWVIFDGGDLENPSANPVNLMEGARVMNAGTNPITMAVMPATGLFKGTVKFPEVLRPVRFQGAVLRGAGLGGGYFAGTNGIGHVYFGP